MVASNTINSLKRPSHHGPTSLTLKSRLPTNTERTVSYIAPPLLPGSPLPPSFLGAAAGLTIMWWPLNCRGEGAGVRAQGMLVVRGTGPETKWLGGCGGVSRGG